MFPLLTLEIEADTTHFAQSPSSFAVPSWSHLETEKELIAGFAYAITLKVTLWDFVRPLLSLTVTKQVLLPLVVKNSVVKLLDVYEGKHLEPGKKSYAISITLQDESQTLNDKVIDKVMQKIIKSLEERAGARLR